MRRVGRPTASNPKRNCSATPTGEAVDFRPTQRDPRIDLLRGFALLTIFIDHIPGNTLGMFTLRNFGFADAAELFVILSGFSSMTAYGWLFHRDGVGSGLRRVAARCARLYLFQVGLLLATLAIVTAATAHFGLVLPDMAPFIGSGMRGVGHSLVLSALPPALDILPLYIVLLSAFPLMYLGVRLRPALTLFVSAAIWGAANVHPGLNFTDWLSGRGWFFNPFAWQFLFVLGVFGPVATAPYRGSLPRVPWLSALCWGYIAFALLASAPWATWGISDFRLLAFAPTDKTDFAPLRALDILALIYLALSSAGFRNLAASRGLTWLRTCGKHSLEVFSLGTILSLAGRLVFLSFGTDWRIEMTVNGAGFVLLLATTMLLETTKAKRPTPAVAPATPIAAPPP